MKGNHWFIAGIIVFLVLMFAIECRLPKKFVWNPTFSHYDKQPFGCAVFDSLLSSSLPKGYSFVEKVLFMNWSRKIRRSAAEYWLLPITCI